jgi:hypothetical protein
LLTLPNPRRRTQPALQKIPLANTLPIFFKEPFVFPITNGKGVLQTPLRLIHQNPDHHPEGGVGCTLGGLKE